MLLDPARFKPLLQQDYDWAEHNIPFFASSDSELTEAYYFRWRIYRF